MNHSGSNNSNATPDSSASPDTRLSLWQQLKGKRISYLTLPLLLMATVVEVVILATGFKYQQAVCVPKGMGVIFLGIGPIGATILAVELLKLPLAIWTASRVGWAKGFMLLVGLPLVCLLTFQLVKDMAVYEMGVALTPASEMLEQASAEEVRIVQLNGELTAIEQKKADREQKLAELAGRKTKSKADLEESLQRNAESRKDAISLTDYQQKELADMSVRQSAIIRQFDAEALQINKAIADLRAHREAELVRATKWNTEDARIENAFKAKLAEYTNKKAAYEKNKAEYESANVLKRQLMKEPVDPGVPPERDSNTVLKPTAIADIDAQISAKQAELLVVNNKRREGVDQVGADARRLRDEFDRRSGTKREEADRKREELLVDTAALEKQWAADEKQIDQEFAAVVQTVDGIRAQIDESRTKAEGFYEAREASIKNTQVHRIATTVEIVRGLLFGKRPVSITSTAKERGDLYTDQISMVRIWVYPVLAFIVAFLPTLMVEIGFSTLFKPEQKSPSYRIGFLGRRLHWLYVRAGRQKILRAERIASNASAEIATRDRALATAKAATEKAIAEREAELRTARESLGAATAAHKEELKQKETEWVAKFTGMADSLNRAITEKDSLRDLQQSEIERQVQARQNAWSDRLKRLTQELDSQRAAHEAERTAMLQEQHQKIMEVSEDCKTQVAEARRQMADAELAAVEKTARLAHDLKEVSNARDAAETQLKQQADSLSLKLSQAREDAAREIEKAARQEKHRSERQQMEFEKTQRQRAEDFEHRLKQREQELSIGFDERLAEEKARIEQEARRREAELENQIEARAREIDARWKQDGQQREEAAQVRLKQREQQMQAQFDAQLTEAQSDAAQELRRGESDFERQLDSALRESDTRAKQELQQKELAFQAKLKQRELQLQSQFETCQAELQVQWDHDLHSREQDWRRKAETAARAVESRWIAELQQKDEMLQSKLRQRDQQWQVKLEAARAEVQGQAEQEMRQREAESVDVRQLALRELEARLRQEMQQNDEIAQARARQREQELTAQLAAQAEAQQALKVLLDGTEKDRDEAKEFAAEGYRQVQNLEKKLTEASSFLNGLKGGKDYAAAR